MLRQGWRHVGSGFQHRFTACETIKGLGRLGRGNCGARRRWLARWPSSLQGRIHLTGVTERQLATKVSVAFIVFVILWDGLQDLTQLPLMARRDWSGCLKIAGTKGCG
jgi:hypothetical protein